MTRPANYLICLFLLMVFAIGCKRIESIPNQRTAQANTVTSALPEGTVISDVSGRALTLRDGDADERTRTAAILDALRNFAISTQNNKTSSAPQDTIITLLTMDGIELLGVTIRRSNVTLLDSVVLQVVNFQNELPRHYRWKSFNMSLVEPVENNSLEFDDLLGSLKARGIEVKSGRPTGRGMWEESLSIRRWTNQ